MASLSPEIFLQEVLNDDVPQNQRILQAVFLSVLGGTVDPLLMTRTKEEKENLLLLMEPANS